MSECKHEWTGWRTGNFSLLGKCAHCGVPDQRRFRTVLMVAAINHGLLPESYREQSEDSRGNSVWCILEFVGKTVSLISTDGGEPGDQVLVRDWSWVEEALEAAYNAGRGEGFWEGGEAARNAGETSS